jgi:hypothetical protein
MNTPILSKSKIMNGLQCERLIWLKTNHPEYAEEISTATRMQLNEGNEVGELARKFFGDGHLIQCDYWDFQTATDETRLAMENNAQIIYEASFLTNNRFARADILCKKNEKWHLIEVKKSVAVKNYQILDSAVQTFIIEEVGIKLASVGLMHIDAKCEYPHLEHLFKTEDVTEQVRMILPTIEDKVKGLNAICNQTIEPLTAIGPQCHNPFDCAFKKYCWKDVPKKSVFDLPMVPSQRRWELYNTGKKLISDLDASQFKGKSQKAIEVTQTNKLWIDTKAIRQELKTWQWPLYFFDFETVGLAIPRYPTTKPYSAIPFQFSCHIWTAPPDPKIGEFGPNHHPSESTATTELRHFEYLHTENSDPRPRLIEALVNNFQAEGSIVSYSKSFEITVIRKLAEFSPEHKEMLLSLIPRFVDPLPLFQNFVYHPDFLGSFSIKSVAPALIGDKLNYKNLAISDGFAALAGAELILNDKIQGEKKQALIDDLLAYCQQDTLAMVEIVKWLFNTCKLEILET